PRVMGPLRRKKHSVHESPRRKRSAPGMPQERKPKSLEIVRIRTILVFRTGGPGQAGGGPGQRLLLLAGVGFGGGGFGVRGAAVGGAGVGRLLVLGLFAGGPLVGV